MNNTPTYRDEEFFARLNSDLTDDSFRESFYHDLDEIVLDAAVASEDTSVHKYQDLLPKYLIRSQRYRDIIDEAFVAVTGRSFTSFLKSTAKIVCKANKVTPVEKEKPKSSLDAVLKEARALADTQVKSIEADMEPVFLFEEDKSGVRMGKPGDAQNQYYAEWYDFYSLDPDGAPHPEKTSLRFMDRDNLTEVPGGNGVSEVEAIQSFRKKHPGRGVIVLSIENSNKDLSERISAAVNDYTTKYKALVELPPCPYPSSRFEPSR